MLSVVVKGIKEMAQQLNDLAATVLGFQEECTTKQLHFDEAAGARLCVGDTCITETELNVQSNSCVDDVCVTKGGYPHS